MSIGVVARTCPSAPSFWVLVTLAAIWPNLLKLRGRKDVSSLVDSSDLTNCSFQGGVLFFFLIYDVKNRNVQGAAEDGHIPKLPAEVSSSRARSKCRRAFNGCEKAQTLRTAPAGGEKG